ncbi:hypothetical protein L210DRAFT_3564626 [Boletus edulis BED1]|uniref:Uncharacterized protein n=1 Tax=Boletus edulis BED1 TaxID=1328754 RepID=A0AAD4BG96_BOLED|nr:hypothetical protein L210DRAFT_3564626 [Boletus edulis BED1]
MFHRLETPSNLPIFKLARGAPPIEHAQSEVIEDDAEDKKVPPRFFDVSYFQGYCEGKVTSESRKTRLEILTREEAEEQRREYIQRQKEKQERIANGEEDEEDEYDEDEDEEDEFES